jgi:superoxide dismutase, Cu-Zn family
MMRRIAVPATVAVLLTLSGASVAGQDDDDARARAVLQDENGERVGVVRWTDADDAVRVEASVEGLPPGFHGFHVHAVGECVPPFTSAGGHLNPDEAGHPEHTGDMPVLLVNSDGTGEGSFVTDRYTLDDIMGRALIIHAAPDNYGNIPDRYFALAPTPAPGETPAPGTNGGTASPGADAAAATPGLAEAGPGGEYVSGPDEATLATGDAGARIACGVIESRDGDQES